MADEFMRQRDRDPSEREQAVDQRERELSDERPPREGDETVHRRGSQHGTGLATGALVVGGLALLLLVGTLGGLFFLALPLGIAAMVMGSRARRRVEAGSADPRGRGRARIGSVLGLIATVLSVLALLLVALGIAALGGIDGLLDEAGQQTEQELQNEAGDQLRGE